MMGFVAGKHRKDPRHRGRHRKPPSPARIALPTGTGVALAVAAVVVFTHDDARGQPPPPVSPASVVATAVQPSVLGFHTTRPQRAPKPRLHGAAKPVVGHHPVRRHQSPAALRLRAIADCYVQVTSHRGRLLVRRILHRHDHLSFRHHGLHVVLGNAGGVRISVDGDQASLAGASGQVRRFHISR
jgi:uncharacterized protein DUF4115